MFKVWTNPHKEKVESAKKKPKDTKKFGSSHGPTTDENEES